MKILDTKIPEVKIIEPDVFGDHRGWFMETWSQPKYESLHFAPMQDNESFTAKKGTLRGIHFQQDPMAQAKIVRVVRGAVMDVAMSISSALTEVHTVAPDRDGRALFRSGMNIGRDMVGTMTNTLILAFLGSGLSFIIYLYSLGLDPRQLISSPYMATEVISGIASSIGVILAVPLTALITSLLLGSKKTALLAK